MKAIDTYSRTVEFFTDLIEETKTYFLSDYVRTECAEYVTEERMKVINNELTELEKECLEAEIDIHHVSQQVAALYMLGLDQA